MPNALSSASARVTTWLAHTLKKPPILGLCNDVVGSITVDQCCDGSKTEKELGIEYTPVRDAIRDEIEGHR